MSAPPLRVIWWKCSCLPEIRRNQISTKNGRPCAHSPLTYRAAVLQLFRWQRMDTRCARHRCTARFARICAQHWDNLDLCVWPRPLFGSRKQQTAYNHNILLAGCRGLAVAAGCIWPLLMNSVNCGGIGVRVTRTPAKSATHGVGIKVYERTNAPGHTGPSVFGCDGAFASFRFQMMRMRPRCEEFLVRESVCSCVCVCGSHELRVSVAQVRVPIKGAAVIAQCNRARARVCVNVCLYED